jgi:hypothetical protein
MYCADVNKTIIFNTDYTDLEAQLCNDKQGVRASVLTDHHQTMYKRFREKIKTIVILKI